MRVAFICFYQAVPPESGAAVASYCSAKYTTGTRLLLQVCDSPVLEFSPDGFQVRQIKAAATSRLTKILGLTRRLSRVTNELEEFNPDVVVLEGSSWVVYHYLLMQRLRKVIPKAGIVYHSHNVEYRLRSDKHGALICALTKWTEGRLCHQSDIFFAVSSTDADHFESLYGVRPGLWPNGVDIARFSRVTPEQIDATREKYGISERSLLFMGLYGYKPNTEAVEFMMRELLPRLRVVCEDVQLVVTGGIVPFVEPWLCNPGVVAFEDIPAIVAACRVGLSPIFSGSGTRLKILEYMAGGLPVVSTRKGAEGLDVIDQKHLLLGETADDFVRGILRILGDTKCQVGTSGREFVQSRYAWPMALNEFEAWLSLR